MKKVKALVLALALLGGIVAVTVVGCTTTQQTVTYKTLYSLEKATTSAYDVYLDMVIKGTIPTNSLPQVSRAFNVFQGGMLVALDANQFNTNALAPSSLQVEAMDVINLITAAKGALK